MQNDNRVAAASLQQAHQLARRVGDLRTLSEVVRHLAFSDLAAGRMESARTRLEESLELCRQLDWTPGVAAALLALAECAAPAGRRDEARRRLDEARSVAEEARAEGILSWIDQAEGSI
ncbi:MAG TPA: tetratricopeptide repeat protein [Candidatus Dormibacteraeota bacterium]|nr:tetratricopeptide repeat protein [Candidatus Dormibacteraeota bacterium]